MVYKTYKLCREYSPDGSVKLSVDKHGIAPTNSMVIYEIRHELPEGKLFVHEKSAEYFIPLLVVEPELGYVSVMINHRHQSTKNKQLFDIYRQLVSLMITHDNKAKINDVINVIDELNGFIKCVNERVNASIAEILDNANTYPLMKRAY